MTRDGSFSGISFVREHTVRVRGGIGIFQCSVRGVGKSKMEIEREEGWTVPDWE